MVACTAMAAPMIDLKAVRLWVDGQPALDGLDLAIEPGESVALLGPMGSHTSTLLQVVLGLRKPDAGRVRVAGQDLGEMDEEIGTARVVELRERFTLAEIQETRPGVELKVKDRVVLKPE